MPVDKKKAIFFAGGKRVQLETNDNAKGLRFERNNAGHWKATIELFIHKDEAENVIRTFSDFGSEEKIGANQVFFAAFDESGSPIDVKMDSAQLSVLFSKDDSGEILLAMRPIAIGKTENVKTENTILDA